MIRVLGLQMKRKLMNKNEIVMKCFFLIEPRQLKKGNIFRCGVTDICLPIQKY